MAYDIRIQNDANSDTNTNTDPVKNTVTDTNIQW